MSEPCSALPPGGGFVSGIANFIDCQSQTLGSGAWQALAAPGSTLSIVLTGFLTIVIALIGYNLLLGRSLTVREATLTFVKVGAVFALATSWPAYRILVYDQVVDGPSQLVSEIGPRGGVIGADGTLLQRLDLADRALAQLAILGPGSPPPGSELQVPPQPFGGFDAFALGGSRILFLVTAIGGLAVVRVLTGLMLALGPFFIAFLLFENTRSLFEGWVRVLMGAALAAVGVSIALGLELALLEPWLSDVLARRMAGDALPTVSVDLFVIACLFAITVLASLWGCSRVARAFRFAPLLQMKFIRELVGSGAAVAAPALASGRSTSLEAERSRASAVASVMVAMERRDRQDRATPAAGARIWSSSTREVPAHNPRGAPTPVGRAFAPRAARRVSGIAARRDSAE